MKIVFDSEGDSISMRDIEKIKSRLFLTFLVFFFFISTGHSQNLEPAKKPDTVFSYSKLVPLEAQEPTLATINKDHSSDSLIFQVILISDSMIVKFHNKFMNTTSITQLDKFIKDNDVARTSSEVNIEASKETPYEKIKAVIQIFRDNSITKFGLVTH